MEDKTFRNKFVYINNKKYGTCKEIDVHFIPLGLRSNIFKSYIVHLIKTDGKDIVSAREIKTAGSQNDILYII